MHRLGLSTIIEKYQQVLKKMVQEHIGPLNWPMIYQSFDTESCFLIIGVNKANNIGISVKEAWYFPFAFMRLERNTFCDNIQYGYIGAFFLYLVS